MVTLLLLLTILHGALQTLSTGNWTEAKLTCSKAGGRLTLPGDDATNSALAEHLQANDVTSAWIDVKSVVMPWHINGVEIIHNQGCHGAGILRNQTYHNAERWGSCRPLCKGHKYRFAGYLRSGSTATCVCLNNITPLGRLRDSKCRGGHYDGYRVVTTSQSTRYPVANLAWTKQSGSIGGICGLTVTVGSGSNPSLRLEEDYCYKLHHALCCVQNTTLKFPLYTWFDAHYKCSVLGGNIVIQKDRCGQSHTDPADYSTTRFWSGAHAWVWYTNDTLTLEHRFTNWSQYQPSLASGFCVYVTQEGAWESASCDESRTIVCQRDESTMITTRHPSSSTQLRSIHIDESASATPPQPSTSSQLTLIHTDTISPSATDSVSSADVPTTQRQRAPAYKSGNAGITAGAVVGALVVLALVGAVIWVLMRRKGKTDRGSPMRLDKPVYSKDNDDFIISRTEIGPHDTTIRENSMYGWSGNNTETSAETNAAYNIDGGDVASGNTTDASNDTQVYSSLEPSTQVSTNEPHLYATVNHHIQRPGDYQQMQAPADQPHLCTSLNSKTQ